LQRTARAKLDHDYKAVPLEELKALRKDIEDAFGIFQGPNSNEIPF
jgi:hypothetical protein